LPPVSLARDRLRETLELRKEEGKSMGQGQTEGERGRERREAGRGKGAGRDEDGGTERQRELGENGERAVAKAQRSEEAL